LAAEIEGVPGSVKRLFEISAPTESADGGPEAALVAATEREVALFQIIRPFARRLSLDASITTALSEINVGIKRAITTLVKGLRTALGSTRRVYLAQISHAVRISAKLFGQESASEIIAATKAAISDEQRTR